MAYDRLCVCVCACPSIPATTDDAPFALRISIQENMPIARESVIVAFPYGKRRIDADTHTIHEDAHSQSVKNLTRKSVIVLPCALVPSVTRLIIGGCARLQPPWSTG